MNWQSISFDWNQVRAFLVTAEEGSLSAAARSLDLTQPTLSRQVAALEETLGLALFERVGKSLVLTKSGLDLLEHVREMGDAANKISLFASGKDQTIDGKVSISASDVTSFEHLPGFIKLLKETAPLLEVEIVAENAISDLLRREADIAIRHVRPEQPDLIARLVAEASAGFYATQQFLDRHGVPNTAADLKNFPFIGFSDNENLIQHFSALGVQLDHNSFAANSGNGMVAWQLGIEGLGICIMSDTVAAKYPAMKRLELHMEPILFPIWLVTHRELHTSRKIRLVFDMLADYLKKLET